MTVKKKILLSIVSILLLAVIAFFAIGALVRRSITAPGRNEDYSLSPVDYVSLGDKVSVTIATDGTKSCVYVYTEDTQSAQSELISGRAEALCAYGDGVRALIKYSDGYRLSDFDRSAKEINCLETLYASDTVFLTQNGTAIFCEEGTLITSDGFSCGIDRGLKPYCALETDDRVYVGGSIDSVGTVLAIDKRTGDLAYTYTVHDGDCSVVRQLIPQGDGIILLAEYSDYEEIFVPDNRALCPIAKKYVQQENKTIRSYAGTTVLAGLSPNGRETAEVTKKALSSAPMFRIISSDDTLMTVGITSVTGTYMRDTGLVTEPTSDYYEGAVYAFDDELFLKQKYDISLTSDYYKTFYSLCTDGLYTLTVSDGKWAVRRYSGAEDYASALSWLSVFSRPQKYIFRYIVPIIAAVILLLVSGVFLLLYFRAREIKKSKKELETIMKK